MLKLVLPQARRLFLYLAAATLLVAAGKGAAINLPGYIREGATGSIVVGAFVWGAFVILAIGCVVLAERKPGEKQSGARRQ